MTDTQIAVLVVLCIGAALGALIFRRRGGLLRLAWMAGALVAVPFVLLGLANVFRSDALGWMGGLSMIALLVAAVPLGIGLAIGAAWSAWRRPPEPPQPVRPIPREPGSSGQPLSPAVDARAAIEFARKGALLVAMGGVLAGFWVVITVGFHLNGQAAPPILDQGLVPAVVVLVISLVLTVRTIWRGWPGQSLGARDPGRPAAQVAAERARYERDPRATATCEHLVPVERAMRDAGIALRLRAPGHVQADCRIDAAALGRWLLLPESVVLEEVAAPERSPHDPPAMRLRCQRCGSSVHVVHPAQAAAGTPVWPPA